jgi:hypothetical protein
MNDFQKSALVVTFAVLVVFAWLAMVFICVFVKVDGQPNEMNTILQGLAVATICLVIGIATPVGSIVTKGAKKVGSAIKGGISGIVK